MRFRRSGSATINCRSMCKSADKNFRLFSANPRHPSLGFAKKGGVHTVEVGRSHRAIARERNGGYYWFWIGTHEAYNNFKF
jgi:hypothetical protein